MSTKDAIRRALRELAALPTDEPSIAESRIERIESVLRAALAADEARETVAFHNPWRSSLENCISGDNYLRSGEYRDLIEELDDLYRLRAIHPPASAAQAEQPLGVGSSAGLGPLAEPMGDYPEPGQRTYDEEALFAFGRQERAAERERLCAAIKAEDDHCCDQGDYMLDSDDCISVIRGTWVRPDYNPKA